MEWTSGILYTVRTIFHQAKFCARKGISSARKRINNSPQWKTALIQPTQPTSQEVCSPMEAEGKSWEQVWFWSIKVTVSLQDFIFNSFHLSFTINSQPSGKQPEGAAINSGTAVNLQIDKITDRTQSTLSKDLFYIWRKNQLSIKKAKNFSSSVFPPCFFMIHNATWRC